MTSLFDEVAEPAADGVQVRRVTITVNGRKRTADIEPRLLLAHLLRQGLRLTGTHTGCDTTNCGACTVLVDGQPVKSCTMFAVQADGHEVTTVEGLAGASELHPLQEGFKQEHGLQCGFCTPGMMLAAKALLDENPDPTEDEIRWALSGNLCRCTGYQNIVKSVLWAADKMRGPQTPRPQPSPRRARSRDVAGAGRDQDRRDGRQSPARRGQPLHPGPGQLRRRHRAARHAAHGDPAQPGRARPDPLHRRQQGLGHPRRPAGAHRRDDGDPQPRLDADPELRHPGRAGHRQGALPGPGGRRRHRRRPLHRQGRLRGDRRRLRAAAGDREPDPVARGGRAPHPRRQGEPARQRHLRLGGRRPGRHRPGLRAGRPGLVARAALPALAPLAAGVLRRDRRLQPVHREADGLHDHPGAAHHPRGRRAGRRAARAHDPDRLPRPRRRLRQQGAGLPGLRRRDPGLDPHRASRSSGSRTAPAT